jgi:hypothetical protein
MPAAERRKYGSVVLVKPALPTRANELIDRILTDLYGQTYSPPKPVKAVPSRSKSSAGATQKPKTISPDAAISELRNVTTTAEAQAVLAQLGRSLNDFRSVADAFGGVYSTKPTIAQLKAAIVDVVMAERKFEVLRRGGMR